MLDSANINSRSVIVSLAPMLCSRTVSPRALPCTVPACLEGGGVGHSASSTQPIRLPSVCLHFFKRSGSAFPGEVFQYPELRPGINRGESSNGARGVLISHQALDTLPLQFSACLGYCDQGGVSVDKSHLSLGIIGESMRSRGQLRLQVPIETTRQALVPLLQLNLLINAV